MRDALVQGIKLLISVASNIIQNAQLFLNQALKDQNLSSAEANVLMFLYNHGDGIPQDTIVAGVEVSKPAISRTINSLEQKGFITRVADLGDKRVRLVSLTSQAREVEARIQQVYAEFVAIAALGVPQAKAEEFTQLMQRVSENIERYLHGEQAGRG